MKFNVNQQDLQQALNYCQGVIEKRSTLPILSNILLDASNSKLTITATDLDLIFIHQLENVEVIEEVPIARWGEQGFLNRLGDELNITDNSTLESLPVLRADYGTSEEMMQHYQLLAELLLPTGLKLIEMQRDHMGAWRVETDEGIELVLGRDKIGEKIKRLALVWQSGLNKQLKQIKTIDLRYPNGLAVAWKDGKLAGAHWNIKQNAVSTVQG